MNFWFYCVKKFINKVIIFILLYLCYSRKYPYFLAEDFLLSPTASLEIPVLICAPVEKNWEFKNHMSEFLLTPRSYHYKGFVFYIYGENHMVLSFK